MVWVEPPMVTRAGASSWMVVMTVRSAEEAPDLSEHVLFLCSWGLGSDSWEK